MVPLMPLPVCHPVVSCFIEVQHRLTFKVLVYPHFPGKRVSVNQERRHIDWYGNCFVTNLIILSLF